jgi:hypothetical protein
MSWAWRNATSAESGLQCTAAGIARETEAQ